MKKNIVCMLLLLSISLYVKAGAEGECMLGSIAGMAATVGLDHLYQNATSPSWEAWKMIVNTLYPTAHDNWFGPAVTLGWETIPELGRENKLYYVGRFFTYYSAYLLTVVAWRHLKKHVFEYSAFDDAEIGSDDKAQKDTPKPHN